MRRQYNDAPEDEKERITDIKFKGTGCAISVASASMLTDFAKGKSVKDVEAMNVKTIIDLIGIDPGPAKTKVRNPIAQNLEGSGLPV